MIREPQAVTMLVRCHRSKLSVWAVLCVLVLCWLYIFPVYRLRSDKEIVDEVLRQGQVWQRNQTDIDLFRWVFTHFKTLGLCDLALINNS